MNESKNPVETTATPAADNAAATQSPKPGRPNGGRDPRWQTAQEQMAANATVTVTVTSIATSKDSRPVGLNVSLNGLRGFLPGSLTPRGAKHNEMIGQTLKVKIVECERGKLVVSLNAQRAEDAAAFVKTLVVGNEVTGRVVSVVDQLGYFVNIGEVEALLHVSQTPLDGGKPKVFQVGDELTARVSSVNLENNKVGLTMRPPRRDRPQGQRDNQQRRPDNRSSNRGTGSQGGNSPTVKSDAPAKVAAPVTTDAKPAAGATVAKRAATAVVHKPAPPRTPVLPKPTSTRRKEQKFGSFAELAAFMQQRDGSGAGEQVSATETTGEPVKENAGDAVEQKG